MKSTKDKILQTLLRKPKITINDLAEAVGIESLSGLTDEQRGNHAELLTMMRSRGLRLTPEEDAARR